MVPVPQHTSRSSVLMPLGCPAPPDGLSGSATQPATSLYSTQHAAVLTCVCMGAWGCWERRRVDLHM
eukprot:365558-Chlamydomonas_euryale.AAC.24